MPESNLKSKLNTSLPDVSSCGACTKFNLYKEGDVNVHILKKLHQMFWQGFCNTLDPLSSGRLITFCLPMMKLYRNQ